MTTDRNLRIDRDNLKSITDDTDREVMNALVSNHGFTIVKVSVLADRVKQSTIDELVEVATEVSFTTTYPKYPTAIKATTGDSATTESTMTTSTDTTLAAHADDKARMKTYSGRKFKKADLARLLVAAENALANHVSDQLKADIDASKKSEPKAESKPEPKVVAKPKAELNRLQLLKDAYNASLTLNQKRWLLHNKRYEGIKFEDMGNGKFKVRFTGFNAKSKSVLAGVFEQACDTKDWYCKVQTSHVYINMHVG